MEQSRKSPAERRVKFSPTPLLIVGKDATPMRAGGFSLGPLSQLGGGRSPEAGTQARPAGATQVGLNPNPACDGSGAMQQRLARAGIVQGREGVAGGGVSLEDVDLGGLDTDADLGRKLKQMGDADFQAENEVSTTRGEMGRLVHSGGDGEIAMEDNDSKREPSMQRIQEEGEDALQLETGHRLGMTRDDSWGRVQEARAAWLQEQEGQEDREIDTGVKRLALGKYASDVAWRKRRMDVLGATCGTPRLHDAIAEKRAEKTYFRADSFLRNHHHVGKKEHITPIMVQCLSTSDCFVLT